MGVKKEHQRLEDFKHDRWSHGLRDSITTTRAAQSAILAYPCAMSFTTPAPTRYNLKCIDKSNIKPIQSRQVNNVYSFQKLMQIHLFRMRKETCSWHLHQSLSDHERNGTETPTEVTRLITNKIYDETGTSPNLKFTAEDLRHTECFSPEIMMNRVRDNSDERFHSCQDIHSSGQCFPLANMSDIGAANGSGSLRNADLAENRPSGTSESIPNENCQDASIQIEANLTTEQHQDRRQVLHIIIGGRTVTVDDSETSDLEENVCSSFSTNSDAFQENPNMDSNVSIRGQTRVTWSCSDEIISNNSISYSDASVLSEQNTQNDAEPGEQCTFIPTLTDLEDIGSSSCSYDSDMDSTSKKRDSQHSVGSPLELLRRQFTFRSKEDQIVTRRMIQICIKYSLFLFNFFSLVAACLSIGVGLWILIDMGKIVTDSTYFFMDPALLICIVGGVTFIVAFLGCLGAVRENLILLKIFFYLLSVIFVGEVTMGVVIFVLFTVPEARVNLSMTPEKVLRSGIIRYMDDDDMKEWMDLIQAEFRCCGIGHMSEEGFRDWQINMYFNCSPNNPSRWRCAVPTSCCNFEPGDRVNLMCGFDMTDKPIKDVKDYIFTRGCLQGFGEWLERHHEWIVVTSLSILIMQFLAVLSSRVMIKRLERHQRRENTRQRQES